MLNTCLSTRSKGEIAKDNFVQTDDVGIKITAFEDDEKKKMEFPDLMRYQFKTISRRPLINSVYMTNTFKVKAYQKHHKYFLKGMENLLLPKGRTMYTPFQRFSLHDSGREDEVYQSNRSIFFQFCWIIGISGLYI